MRTMKHHEADCASDQAEQHSIRADHGSPSDHVEHHKMAAESHGKAAGMHHELGNKLAHEYHKAKAEHHQFAANKGPIPEWLELATSELWSIRGNTGAEFDLFGSISWTSFVCG